MTAEEYVVKKLIDAEKLVENGEKHIKILDKEIAELKDILSRIGKYMKLDKTSNGVLMINTGYIWQSYNKEDFNLINRYFGLSLTKKEEADDA